MGVSESRHADSDSGWNDLLSRKSVALPHPCALLLSLKHEQVFETFLHSGSNTFILPLDKCIGILEACLIKQRVGAKEAADVTQEFKIYLKECIAATSTSLDAPIDTVDMLSICSLVLLVSSISSDEKVRYLFQYMDIGGFESISFDDFFIGVMSFASGLQIAHPSLSVDDEYICSVATQWFRDAAKATSSDSIDNLSISSQDLLVFSSNRHHSLFSLLDTLRVVVLSDKDDLLSSEVALSSVPTEPTAGDEWMANPAWKKTAERMVPKGVKRPSSAPDAALAISWVHGYRGFDCRNNVFFLDATAGEIGYHVAALAIAQNAEGIKTQKYFQEHTDDIISMAVHADAGGWTMVATGDMGRRPTVHVYCYRGGCFTSEAALSGHHSRGVTQLCFSADGTKLISIGLEYSVVVFCVTRGADMGKVLAIAQGPKEKVLHCCAFDAHFLSCGEKHIALWTLVGSSAKCELIKLGAGKSKMFLSAVPLTIEYAAAATSEGDVYILHKNTLLTVNGKNMTYKAHEKAVNAMWASGSGKLMVTGGADGIVILWSFDSGKLEKLREFELFGFTTNPKKPPPVRAVCLSSDSKKLVVGSQTCEILAYSCDTFAEKSTSKIVVNIVQSGHYKDELWGIDVCPQRGEFCTVGDDSTLRIFNLDGKSQLVCKDLGIPARCCAYSPDGSIIAVGFAPGATKASKQCGYFCLFKNDHSLALVLEVKDTKRDITELKYSPDGSLLAVGSSDCSICIYSVNSEYKKKVKFSKHAASISHFDFSADGAYLQSNCNAYELLFCETASGNHITNGATLLASTTWATWTCTLGYASIGVWSSGMDGSDINALCRSPDGKLLAVGDDFGKVSLFTFPAVVEGSPSHSYRGHSSHVTNVRWMVSSSALFAISTGGNDKSIIIWSCSDVSSGGSSQSSAPAVEIPSTKREESVFTDMLPTQGDEFMATKPWLGAIFAPSAFSSTNTEKSKDPQPFIEYASKLKALEAVKSLEEKKGLYLGIKAAARLALESSLVTSIVSDASPECSDEFDLEWVYGYRGYDCRNNIYRISANCIVYPAAALVIVLDISKREQTYFRGHTDDVMAIAIKICVDSVLVASSQIGPIGCIFIWESHSLKILATLQTKQKNIQQLSFLDMSGMNVIISIAQDNTVVAVDWKANRIIVNVKGEPALTMGISAAINSTSFMSCGDKHVRYWTLNGSSLTSEKVSVATVKGGTVQQFLSVAYGFGSFFIGCADGSVYVAQGKVVKWIFTGCQTSIEKDAIASLYVDEHSGALICGSSSGNVCIWDGKAVGSSAFAPISSFSIATLMPRPTPRQIQSIASFNLDLSNPSIVLGTRGCDIIEVVYRTENAITPANLTSLVQGHNLDELWGYSSHPFQPMFCTTGDDRTLRIWSIHSRAQIGYISLGGPSRACSYDPLGLCIAVGYGGKVGGKKSTLVKEGTVRLYSASCEYDMLFEVFDSKKSISDVKFTSSGSVLAVGSHDTNVYIYDVQRDAGSCSLKLKFKFTKHNAAIAHIDLSMDGKYMQSCCNAYELLFSDLLSGKHISSAKELRDVKWDTWSSTIGWPCQGIWESGYDGSDINAVARSNSGHLLASGDDFSKVKIYMYPTLNPDSARKLCLTGHSSHVTNVGWTVGDECLITVGGEDKCIFQWRHSIVGNASEVTVAEENSDFSKPTELFLSGPSGGDESSAVKPWMGAIRPPKTMPSVSSSAPSASLALEWVHGYSAFKVGSSAMYNQANEIVYPAAALVVKCNRGSELMQSYFIGHNDDITCIAITADRHIVATGQIGSKTNKGKANVIIWNASDCRILQRLDACHDRGVSTLSFSANGTFLISVGQDNNNTHTLWEDKGGQWSKVAKLCSVSSDKSPVLFSKWLTPTNSESSDFQILSGGVAGIQYWKIDGASMSKKMCLFGSKKKSTILNVASFDSKKGWRVAAASSTGDIFLFKNREVSEVIESAHIGAVYALTESSDFKCIVSGGKDGLVKVWNDVLESISIYDTVALALSTSPAVCSLDINCIDSKQSSILIGTAGGDLVELSNVDLKNSVNSKAFVLVSSHCSGELWGLAPHPTLSHIFATVGDDSTLRIWSMKDRHRMLKCISLRQAARAVAWSHSGNYLVVGFINEDSKSKKKNDSKNESLVDGSVHLFSFEMKEDGSVEITKRIQGCRSTAWICDVKFSPDDRLLCIASHDKVLYGYDISALSSQRNTVNWTELLSLLTVATFEFKKHSSAVLHFDFSRDSQWIQTNCQAYELLYLSTSGVQETSSSRLADYNGTFEINKEEKKVWHTQTCVLGWAVQGIWPTGVDGSEINCIDRNSSGELLATGDDSSRIKLFRFPCSIENSKSKEYTGHSSHVTTVRWTLDDHLISVGGKDCCTMIWRVVKQ